MAPKSAKRASKRESLSVQPQAKKPKKQSSSPESKPAEEVNLEIVLISGRRVGSLAVQPALKVHDLREKILQLADKAGISTAGKIAQILHEAKVLEDGLTVAESIKGSSVLTLKFEAFPMKLLTISRQYTVSQATTEVTKIKAKLGDHESSLGVVTLKVSELTSKVAKQKKLLRAAEKELAEASSSMSEILQRKSSLLSFLATVEQDTRTDYERISETVLKSLAITNVSPKRFMRDVCDLHAAGEIDDEEFANIANMIAESNSFALQNLAVKDIITIHSGAGGTAPCESHLRALEKLATKIVASTQKLPTLSSHDWLPLAKAVCLNSQATVAVLLVEGVVAHAGRGNSNCWHTMYPVLQLLRQAELPAVTSLETALCAKLAEGRANIDWMEVANAICNNEDSAVAPSFVRGVVARGKSLPSAVVGPSSQSTYWSNVEIGGGWSTPSPSRPSASRSRICPLVDFMAPIFVKLCAFKIPEMHDLQSTLISKLEAAVAEKLITTQDFSMPVEAAQIGERNRKLRDFLLSSVQCQVEFNETKAGRMAIHRLIDSAIHSPSLPRKLTHSSTGGGHSRTLVVRKAGLEQARQTMEQKAELQSQHQQLLRVMKEFGVGQDAPEARLALEQFLDCFSRPAQPARERQCGIWGDLFDDIRDLFDD